MFNLFGGDLMISKKIFFSIFVLAYCTLSAMEKPDDKPDEASLVVSAKTCGIDAIHSVCRCALNYRADKIKYFTDTEAALYAQLSKNKKLQSLKPSHVCALHKMFFAAENFELFLPHALKCKYKLPNNRMVNSLIFLTAIFAHKKGIKDEYFDMGALSVSKSLEKSDHGEIIHRSIFPIKQESSARPPELIMDKLQMRLEFYKKNYKDDEELSRLKDDMARAGQFVKDKNFFKVEVTEISKKLLPAQVCYVVQTPYAYFLQGDDFELCPRTYAIFKNPALIK